MYDPDDNNPDALSPWLEEHEAHAQPRGWTWIAWIGILAFVGFTVYIQNFFVPPPAPPQAAAESRDMALMLTEIMGRMIVGWADVARMDVANNHDDEIKQMYEEYFGSPHYGSIRQRLDWAIFANEMVGPAEAQQQLLLIQFGLAQEGLQVKPEIERARKLLAKVFRDYSRQKYDAPSLQPDDREFLVQELGWAGQLALAPRQGPNPLARAEAMAAPLRLFWVLISVVIGGIVLSLIGLLVLIVYFVAVFLGTAQCGITPPQAHSGVYAETFALWLVLHLGMSLSVEAVQLPAFEKILALILGSLASLVVLAWPLMRGLKWSTICSDIGLNWGRGGLREPFMGSVTYCMMLPFLWVGLFIVLFLLALTAQQGGAPAAMPAAPNSIFAPDIPTPTHPIIEYAQDPQLKWLVLILAAVVAPIVEEIMFRGLLYRQLRDGSRWLGVAGSVVFSTFLTSFVFAVIHPQGLIAVPALMGIAFGLTLAREWRDSLIAPIVTHGISNGIVFGVLIAAVN